MRLSAPATPAPGCGWSRREKGPRSGKDEIVDEHAKKWNQKKLSTNPLKNGTTKKTPGEKRTSKKKKKKKKKN